MHTRLSVHTGPRVRAAPNLFPHRNLGAHTDASPPANGRGSFSLLPSPASVFTAASSNSCTLSVWSPRGFDPSPHTDTRLRPSGPTSPPPPGHTGRQPPAWRPGPRRPHRLLLAWTASSPTRDARCALALRGPLHPSQEPGGPRLARGADAPSRAHADPMPAGSLPKSGCGSGPRRGLAEGPLQDRAHRVVTAPAGWPAMPEDRNTCTQVA